MWVSFAEPGKFLGAVIIEAIDVEEAVTKCWRLGINPGGSVLGAPLSDMQSKALECPRNKLLSPEYLKSRGIVK